LRFVVPFLLATILFACDTEDDVPWMEPIGDREVVVHDTLEIVIRAEDPGGGRLTFYIEGRPDGADFYQDETTATFLWTPAPAQASAEGTPYPMTVSVEDESGRFVSERFVVTVYPGSSAPRFIGPSSYGLAATQEDFVLRVEVRDEDSALVMLEMAEGPDGAVFEQDEPKSGLFRWAPTDDQRSESAVFGATFRADDGDNPVVWWQLVLVIL